MDKERKEIAERILNLTVEIIYLLTGEDYIVVKKIPDEHEEYSGDQVPITGPLLYSLIEERNSYREILELTNKITELLTGEVPVRCQDVAVHLSMEEWKYLEKHKDQYEDIIVEDDQTPTSPDESNEEETQERCPSPLYSKVYPEGNRNIPRDHQVTNMIDIKVEDLKGEPYVNVSKPCKEQESPTNDSNVPCGGGCLTDESSKKETLERCPSPLYSKDYAEENQNIPQDHQVTNLRNIKMENKTEEDTYPGIAQLCKQQEIPTNISTDNCTKNVTGHLLLSPDYKVNYFAGGNGVEHPSTLLTTNLLFVLHSRDLATNPTNHMNHLSGQPQSTGEKHVKIFPCSECGKCFKRKSILTVHERIHRDERPFSCSECTKSFRQKSDLIVHQRRHTGVKPYPCPECGKCFIQKSVLVTHLKIHTGEKPFSCPECGKCFCQKSDLVNHRLIHTGERPFSCSECEKSYNHRSALAYHRKRIHPKTVANVLPSM